MSHSGTPGGGNMVESPASAVSAWGIDTKLPAPFFQTTSPRARCLPVRTNTPPVNASSFVNELSDAHFTRLYTNVLSRLCNANGMNSFLPDKHDKVSIFFSTFRQPFSLESYVTRIVNFTNCSRSVFINALVYLDRIKRADKRLAISEMNVHRILITAVVLSVKFLEDELYHNSYFAKVGGIQSVAEFVGWPHFLLQVPSSRFSDESSVLTLNSCLCATALYCLYSTVVFHLTRRID